MFRKLVESLKSYFINRDKKDEEERVKKNHASASDTSEEHDCSALVSTWSEVDDTEDDDAFRRERSQSTSFEEEHPIGHISLIAKSKHIEHIQESTDSGTDTASDVLEYEEGSNAEGENRRQVEESKHLTASEGEDVITPLVDNSNNKSLETLVGNLHDESLIPSDNYDIVLGKNAISKELIDKVESPQEFEVTTNPINSLEDAVLKDNAFETLIKLTDVSKKQEIVFENEIVEIAVSSPKEICENNCNESIVPPHNQSLESIQVQDNNSPDEIDALINDEVINDIEENKGVANVYETYETYESEADNDEAVSPEPEPEPESQPELSKCIQTNGNTIFLNRSYRTVLEDPLTDDEHINDYKSDDELARPHSYSDYENNDLESEHSLHSFITDNLHRPDYNSYESESDDEFSISETPWFKRYKKFRYICVSQS